MALRRLAGKDLSALHRAGRPWRGALGLRLALAAVLLVVLSGVLAGGLMARAASEEALQRLLAQQADATEMVARMLSGKIEQSQKALRTVAAGITPEMLDSPAQLEALLEQSMPAIQLFDFVQVAGQDGRLRVNLRYGHFEQAASLEPAERDSLRRTLVQGKPGVSELVAGRTRDARVMFTMPLHRADGTVMGVVAGGLPLQSQALLSASMALPERDGARLVVFARDGTILLHSDPAHTLGQVRNEPGLAELYQEWTAQQTPVQERGRTWVRAEHVISVAGMPLPQWQVARVSDARLAMASLHAAQRQAAWMATAGMAVLVVLAVLGALWMALPLARLQERTDLLLNPGEHSALPPWPEESGEVGALAQAFEAAEWMLEQQGAQLQTVQNRFDAVLELAGIGIVVSRNGQLEAVGRHASQMLGYTQAELRGRALRSLYRSDEEYLQTRARMRASFAAHAVLGGEVRLQRKDGSPVWLRAQGRHVVPGERDSGTLWLLQDLAASHEARQQQSWIATHDALTQLVNRAGCEQQLSALLLERRAQRTGQPGADRADRVENTDAASGVGGTADDESVFLYLDLDHFAVINNTAGQAAGDDVLCHVAQLLQAQVGQSGWVARLGGDKYGVLLPSCSTAHAAAVAEQLRLAVQAWEPVYQGRSFALGVSIGMVVLDAQVQDAAAVLQAADMACYRAKRLGRNQVQVHASAPAPLPSPLPLPSPVAGSTALVRSGMVPPPPGG